MTAVQQPPRHSAPTGSAFTDRHPSGPVPVAAGRRRAAEIDGDAPTIPISRAALAAARPGAPAVPFAPVATPMPMPMPSAPRPAAMPTPMPIPMPAATAAPKRRRWPWVVGGIVLLFVIIGMAGGGNAPAPTTPASPAPSVASAPSAVTAPAQVTLPAEVTGRNAQIVDGELRGLGLTNITYASQDPQDTVVVLLQNWTVTGIEPGAGTSVAPGQAVVVSVTKGGASGSTPAAGTTPAAGPATSFGDGTHVVGQDIEPGTYRTAGPAVGSFGTCYWSRLRNTSGELDGIIANGLPTGPATVTIRSGDAAFETTGCQTWTKTN